MRTRGWAVCAFVLVGCLLFSSLLGCTGNDALRYQRVKSMGDAAAYERFLQETDNPGLHRRAKNELAAIYLVALDENTPFETTRTLAERFSETPSGPALREKYAEALYRHQGFGSQENLEEYRASVEVFAGNEIAGEKSKQAIEQFNEAVIARIRSSRAQGEELVLLIGLLLEPGIEQRIALEKGAIQLFRREEPSLGMLQLMQKSLPEWFSRPTSERIITAQRRGVVAQLVKRAGSAAELRPLLFNPPVVLPGNEQFALQQKYDELLSAELGEEGTLSQALAYLNDPLAQMKRAQLQDELAILKAPPGRDSLQEIRIELYQKKPYLRVALKRRESALAEVGFLEREREWVGRILKTPDDFPVTTYAKLRIADKNNIKILREDRFVNFSNFLIETTNRFTTGVVFTDSGLVLALDYDIARIKPPTATGHVKEDRFELKVLATDPVKGWVLMKPTDLESKGFKQLVPAKLIDVTQVLLSVVFDLRYNNQRNGGQRIAGQVELKSNDLPGSETTQTFRLIPQEDIRLSGGVVYTAGSGGLTYAYEGQGELLALVARRVEDGKYDALGVNEAWPLIDTYYEQAIAELSAAITMAE